MNEDLLVSADSHVVEPPEVYVRYIASSWRDHTVRLAPDNDGGECYIVPGSTRRVGLGLASAAGAGCESLSDTGVRFSEIRPGAWQAEARLRDQDVDGVDAEVLYPTVALFLLDHINRSFSAACMAAYNTWVTEFCEGSPERLIGCGASAVISADDASRDLERIRHAGLRGAILPLAPSVGSYIDPEYDLMWSAAVGMDLPLTFHAVPPRHKAPLAGAAASAILPIWDAQELLTGLIFGGVFHRWPALRVVLAEFDAGWVPHFVQRLDHYFHRNYRWLKLDTHIDRPPSDYIGRSVYFTFQDDAVALAGAGSELLNFLWASDFPHAESTWPNSMKLAALSEASTSRAQRRVVFGGATRGLYRIA